MSRRPLLLYRAFSLGMAACFAVVGLLFFFLPGQVIGFFNRLSPGLGLSPAPADPGSFFPILALAYMAVVTSLAAQMALKPGNPAFPALLVQGKLASSLLSLVFFFGRAPHLVCLANAVVDGLIALLVLWLLRRQKKHAASWPA